MEPGTPRGTWDWPREAIYAVAALLMGVSLGVGLRAAALSAQGAGRTARPGTGAVVFALIVGGLLAIFGDVLLARRGARLALAVYPLAMLAGFALFGGL